MRKLIVLIIFLVAGCGMQLTPTPEKAYEEDTKKLRAIKEHQILQLEIMNINAAIAQRQVEARKNVPNFNLTPAEPEKAE